MQIKIFDIDIKIHWSWYLFAAAMLIGDIVTFNIPGSLFSLSCIIGAAIFITIHELSHALTARQFGAKTHSIQLFALGGVAWIQNTRKLLPLEIMLISLAGPASNFVMFSFFVLLAVLTGWNILYLAATINLIIGVFNLIPAYPLDGGQIFRALLQENNVELAKANKISQYLAVGCASLLIFGGVFFGYLGFALIGLFILVVNFLESKAITN